MRYSCMQVIATLSLSMLVMCGKSSNCLATTSHGDCKNCMPGYYLNATACEPCTSGCNRCLDADACLECKETFILEKRIKKCYKCEDDNCAKCRYSQICEECKEGYQLQSMSRFSFFFKTDMCTKREFEAVQKLLFIFVIPLLIFLIFILLVFCEDHARNV